MQDTKITLQQAMAQAGHFLEMGNLQQAEILFRQALQIDPQKHEAYFQLGLIASRVNKMDVAAQFVAQAIQIDPMNAGYHKAQTEICRRLGRLDLSLASGQQAVILAPGDVDAHFNYGIALADAGQIDLAVEQYKLVLNYDPSHGRAANNMGTILEKLGDEAGAQDYYSRAIAINPYHAEAQNNLGAILSAQGELDGARQCFSMAIAAEPGFVHSHYNLSTLKKYTIDDPHYHALEEVAKNAHYLPEETRLRFWFAIGKAREDVERYDDAFYAYEQGNSLKRKTFDYDGKKIVEITDDIMVRFDKDYAHKPAKGCTDETPIFIVGMPRSGTTLMEQILSSHTEIFGAGELKDLSDVITNMGASQDLAYMDWLMRADESVLQAAGEAYVRRLRDINGSAKRVVDKMPGNFFFVGLIKKILPNAKIIHATRNPMDICLSNYSRLFNETMPFAYDLGDLGRYYRNYDRLMKHWADVLPAGSFLEMKYEEIVEDVEGQAHRLIDYCGLEWQDSCLEFHKNKRLVKTASIAQVRRPIYKSSVERAQLFGKHLQPLRDAIDGK